MSMPLSLDPTVVDSPNRAVRVFTFSKIGQSKLLPSSRRSLRSDGKVITTALPLQDRREYACYVLKVYTRRTEEIPLWSKRDDSPARPVR